MTVLDDFLPLPAVEATDWPRELPQHLSPSQVSDFLLCPEKYRLARVMRLPQRSNVNLVIGTADTRANEANMRQVIESGEMLDVEQVQDAASDAFIARVDEDGGASEVDWQDTKPADARDKAVLVAATYRETTAGLVVPIAVEQKIDYRVDGAPPVVGYLDVEQADTVIEKKTAGSLTRVIQPHWRPQALIYAAAAGKPVGFHVTTKAATPKVTTPDTDAGLEQPVEPYRAARLVGMVADGLRDLVASRGPDGLWPGNGLTHPWACQLCAFKANGCAYWKGAL